MFADLDPTDIFTAARNIREVVRRTTLRPSPALARMVGGEVLLKMETEQITGSFKLRGAFNALATLAPDERARGVVASSAGNHGLGVAYAARHFRVPATIFVPASAPEVKKKGIAELGASVDDSQPDYDAAMSAAKAFAAERGAEYINPCLGRTLLAGQGTVALEILEERADIASVVLPVGGGGLLGGVASLLRRVAPHVRIAGAQSVNTAAMARSLDADRLVEIASVPTLADGLAGQIDEEALDIGRHGLDEITTLSEEEIASAIAWLAENEEEVVEGAGAAGVAAVLHRKLRELPSPAVVVVSGRNIDAQRHAKILSEHQSQAGKGGDR